MRFENKKRSYLLQRLVFYYAIEETMSQNETVYFAYDSNMTYKETELKYFPSHTERLVMINKHLKQKLINQISPNWKSIFFTNSEMIHLYTAVDWNIPSRISLLKRKHNKLKRMVPKYLKSVEFLFIEGILSSNPMMVNLSQEKMKRLTSVF